MKKFFILLTACYGGFTFTDKAGAQNILQVSTGTEFSMALDADNVVWTWGSNSVGQLGDSSTNNTTAPKKIYLPEPVVQIKAGSVFSLAIGTSGKLYRWGFKLGDPDIASLPSIKYPVQLGTDEDWSALAAGENHGLGLKQNGTLWGWGYNVSGVLGEQAGNEEELPVQIGKDNNWKKISAGGQFNAAIKKDGTLWVWGANNTNQLAIVAQIISSPIPLQVSTENDWIEVSCGYEYVLALKSDGTLWSWGFNGNGQLGTGSSATIGNPTKIGNDNDWKVISAGSSFGFAIKNNGTLWGWGYNAQGQLGINGAQQNSPVQIGTESDWAMVSGAIGTNVSASVFGLHSLALKTSAQSVCVAGANYAGQLGIGTTDNNPHPEFNCTVSFKGDSTTSIGQVQQAIQLHLYPNPVSSVLWLDQNYDLDNSNLQVCIYDISGRCIQNAPNYKVQGKISLDVSAILPGLYFLKITDRKGRFYQSRFIKE